MARLVYAFNYLLCVILGAFIGFVLGGVLWGLMVEFLFPPSWEAAIFQSGHEEALHVGISFAASGYSIS